MNAANIPNIVLVCNIILSTENPSSQHNQNSFLLFKKTPKSKIFDMDRAQHIKMDYAQNLIKDQVKDHHKISTGCSAHFAVLQYKEFAVISSTIRSKLQF